MKRILLVTLGFGAVVAANAQVTLFDNGPMVTHAGQGAGGADVSMCSVDPNTAGSNRLFLGDTTMPEYYSVADDFKLNADATLTSIVVYGYETNLNTPDWTSANVNLWQGAPNGGGSIIATATSVSWAQTKIFRVFNGVANLLNTARKINAITAVFNNVPLTAGTTYWVSSQVVGGATGWANYVMDINQADPNNPITRAGNGLQHQGAAGWVPAVVGTSNLVNVEFPFLVKGLPATVRVVPSNLTVNLGKIQTGDVNSLSGDDGNRLIICKFFVPNQQAPIIQFVVSGTGAPGTCSDYSLVAKAKMVQAGSFKIVLEGYNYTGAAFDGGTSGTINLGDQVFAHHVAGAPANDYVSGGSVQGRVKVFQTGPSTALLPCANFEYVNWILQP